MHISVQMTLHIIIYLLHAHICTNDFTYYYWFSSCTSLYKWLSILFFIFCHAHICTNDYPYYFLFSSCTSLYKLLSLIFWFCHAHLCTNDYPYYFWFSSCTYPYEWLSILFLVFVMHISVQMTIHNVFVFVLHISVGMTIHIIFGFVMHISVQMTINIIFGFCHAHLCTNDFFVPNFFPIHFCQTGIFSCFLVSFSGINIWGREPWCLSSRGEFLGVFISNVSVSPSAQCSPTGE